MTRAITKLELARIIHNAVAEYANCEFNDEDNFVSDLKLASDDLSAIALSFEKRFNVKIERHRYRNISNVNDYVELLIGFLDAGKES